MIPASAGSDYIRCRTIQEEQAKQSAAPCKSAQQRLPTDLASEIVFRVDALSEHRGAYWKLEILLACIMKHVHINVGKIIARRLGENISKNPTTFPSLPWNDYFGHQDRQKEAPMVERQGDGSPWTTVLLSHSTG
ncbi:hypothetical protein HAX54_023051 [Datura stramonium]|uniref:Uncharacterized protein n=1 Tax=Datura stramonium TaxID=4076 RepID=A0ABS8S7E3_DATST|nr:hypothetical protein [Datura stramonium]